MKNKHFFDRFLDWSVFYSFEKSGFQRHQQYFADPNVSIDGKGKVALVTGANSGIGFALAQQLAERHCTVYLLCRNPQRGNEAVEKIQLATGNTNVHLGQVDLSDLNSVRHFAQELTLDSIDIFVHNAGILPLELSYSPQNIESTLATNLVGHHLLTRLLEGKLSQARMILMSSGGMYLQALDNQKLFSQQFPKFDGVQRYALTKRAQVILAKMWQERWAKDANLQGSVFSMHPGWVATPGVAHSLPGFWKMMEGRLRDSEEGADTALWLALSDEVHPYSGSFFFDREVKSPYLFPWHRESPKDRQELWTGLERLIQDFL